jgi:DNA-binding NtrC family response regulator
MSMSDDAGTHVMAGRVTEFRYHRFRLRVVDGPDRGREQVCDGNELSIGSDPGNHLVLTDPTVSGHHCVITATPQGFLFRDLDSTNGSTLAGYRVALAYLKAGAVLGLGASLLRFDRLEEEVGEPVSPDDRFGGVIGKSVAMRRIFAVLPRIAASDSTLLIAGETGTGKGVLAEAVHQASPRAKNPFVVVDCGAIPPTLIESELFGHARGAFTGAVAARAGAFEAAQGGTIFLDEVGELPLDLQQNLLRALEERTVKRIGAIDRVRLDVRVIAATNRDLRQAINRGAFRADLYYRLHVVRIELPPLRERREDVPLLVGHFYAELAGAGAAPPPELLASLSQHDWPGNVRELRAAVERSLLLGDPQLWNEIVAGEPAAPASQGPAPDVFDAALSFRAAKERAMARWERWYVTELVRRAGGNLSRAAREARMDRTHLRELVRRYDAPLRDD